MKQNNAEFTLKDLLNFILSKIGIVVLCMILAGASMFLFAKTNNTVSHSVSMSLFVESISGNTSNVSISKQRVPLYMEIISSNRDFHKAILLQLGEVDREKYGFSKNDPDDLASLRKLASMIRTEQSGDLEMFYVHVTASTEECALRISEIVKELAIESDPTKNAVYKNIGAPSTISCVDSPRANGASVSQNLKLNLLIGIFGGAMLSVLALWLYSSFDTHIRNRRALELNFDIPVLGVIPKVSSDSMTVSAYLEKRRTDNAQ
jgi:capsular polysaccharide biosynthesis protein